MKFEYNRDRKTLLNVINSKAEKKNIRVDAEKEKIMSSASGVPHHLAYKMQTGNIVLCAIAAVLLIVVLAVVVAKANKPKEIITKFLQDLNIK